MKAMVLKGISRFSDNEAPLEMLEMPVPVPGDHEILVKVSTCGVCHTELDEIEGRTSPPAFPIIPGHEIVGTVVDAGRHAHRFARGDRVGIGWIHSACGVCPHCRSGNENVCPSLRATGRDAHGGYGEYTTVKEAFAYPIPEVFSDGEAAPLLCAGAIGYRSLRLASMEDGRNLGLTGFGASAHLVLKMARHLFPSSPIYVFARNVSEQAFARELGAVWAGDTADEAPEKLHSIIDTTPAWKPVVEALKNLAPGGRLVINAIRKEDRDKDYLLNLHYPVHLWCEKEIKSVANVARRDISEFLTLAAEVPITPHVETYTLSDANKALADLAAGNIRGGKVLAVANESKDKR
jgi:propanol-preferring alcohol dehydrogenase